MRRPRDSANRRRGAGGSARILPAQQRRAIVALMARRLEAEATVSRGSGRAPDAAPRRPCMWRGGGAPAPAAHSPASTSMPSSRPGKAGVSWPRLDLGRNGYRYQSAARMRQDESAVGARIGSAQGRHLLLGAGRAGIRRRWGARRRPASVPRGHDCDLRLGRFGRWRSFHVLPREVTAS